MLDTSGAEHRVGARPWTRLLDAHVHVIDPAYPLTANNGYVPEPFTIGDYRARTSGLGVEGGAVVAGSFQGLEQEYMVDALAGIGPGLAGVIQLSPDVFDRRVLELDAAGVRAVRFNLYRGGSAGLEDLGARARRVHDLAGWHTEHYLDAADLPELAGLLASLPSVSIDHLGMTAEGVPHLLRLVEKSVRVKADGFGRVDLAPSDVVPRVMEVDPGRSWPPRTCRRPAPAGPSRRRTSTCWPHSSPPSTSTTSSTATLRACTGSGPSPDRAAHRLITPVLRGCRTPDSLVP